MNFTWMPRKEKDFDIAILWTQTDATHLQTDIKLLERKLQTNESPSSDFPVAVNNLLMDIETVASDPFYLQIVFGWKSNSNTSFDRNW